MGILKMCLSSLSDEDLENELERRREAAEVVKHYRVSAHVSNGPYAYTMTVHMVMPLNLVKNAAEAIFRSSVEYTIEEVNDAEQENNQPVA
jgi:hypothetical protein